MKKAPTNRGLLVRTWFTPLSGRPCYFFFFGRLLLRGGFLGCALHRLILPKHQILRFENRNVIHI